MNFEPIKQKSTIVALGYSFDSFNFVNTLRQQSLYDKYAFSHQPLTIIGSNRPIDEQEIKKLKGNPPITTLKSEKKGIYVDLASFQGKLNIINEDFNPDDIEEFTNIAYDLFELKFSEIPAIGINFISDFDLGNKTLKLLDKKVESIKDFDKNITFQLVLPIKLDEYIATYKVQKLIDSDSRIYQIDVNFHIELSSKRGREKLDLLDNYLKNLKQKFYQPFYEKCQEFLNLHYE